MTPSSPPPVEPRDSAAATEWLRHAFEECEHAGDPDRECPDPDDVCLGNVIARARSEGYRQGIEAAEAACESYVGDTDGSAFGDGKSVAREQIANRIHRLLPPEVPR